MQLTIDDLRRWLGQFLCDNSDGSKSWLSILSNADFVPDTFTIQERMTAPTFLAEYERDFEAWLFAVIEERLRRMFANYAHIEQTLDLLYRVRDDVMILLEYKMDGTPIAARLYNQEFPYVLDRLLAWRLFGKPWQAIHQYRAFNEVGFRILTALLLRASALVQKAPPQELRRLFALAVTAGLLGLDLKSSPPTGPYIPLQDALHGHRMGTVRSYDDIWNDLITLANRPFTFDAWDVFEHELSSADQLAWFFDDYIETGFDLLFIATVLYRYPRLRILAIPKLGQHDNDASVVDVEAMLAGLAPLAPLNELHRTGRFVVAQACPRMGTVNLRKLATPLVDSIATSQIVFVKGARVHELIQGGLNKTTYTAYVLTREFNEAQTGLDSRLSPLLLFRADPGEYCWWGFRGRRTRHVTFADGRTIPVCYSTIADHLERQDEVSSGRIKAAVSKLHEIEVAARADGYLNAWRQELTRLHLYHSGLSGRA